MANGTIPLHHDDIIMTGLLRRRTIASACSATPGDGVVITGRSPALKVPLAPHPVATRLVLSRMPNAVVPAGTALYRFSVRGRHAQRHLAQGSGSKNAFVLSDLAADSYAVGVYALDPQQVATGHTRYSRQPSTWAVRRRSPSGPSTLCNTRSPPRPKLPGSQTRCIRSGDGADRGLGIPSGADGAVNAPGHPRGEGRPGTSIPAE